MEAQLRAIISRIAEIPGDFSDTANLRDELEVDSFRSAEIAFEIERLFGVKIPDETYAEAKTAREILQLLHALQK